MPDDVKYSSLTFTFELLINQNFSLFETHSINDEGYCTCGNKLCKSPGKHPKKSGWQKNATTDLNIINRIWPDNQAMARKNVALATGDPSCAFVLDIDPRHGGDKSFEELIEKIGPLPETLVVDTGGGGQHYYFKMPKGVDIRNSAGKLGEGIDIRANGGYVIAPPSKHVSGNRYVIRSNNELAEAPVKLLELIVTTKKTIKTKRDKSKKKTSAYKKSDNSDQTANLDQIYTHCSWLKNCRDNAPILTEPEWHRALTVTARCVNGTLLSHRFSEPHPDYTYQETDDKIEHALKDSGPITCDYVEANLPLGEACKQCIFRGRIKSPIHLGIVNPLIFKYVYIIDQELFYELETGLTLSNVGFSKAYAHIGKGLSSVFLASKVMIKVYSRIYEPLKPKIVIEKDKRLYLNIWRGSDVTPVAGDVKNFIDHMNYLFPDEDKYQMVMDFLAYCVQRQGEKIHYAMVIIGQQGTGKSYIGTVLSNILGSSNVSEIETTELTSNFNSWLEGKSLVVVEEMRAGNRQDTANALKSIITQPNIRVNVKYQVPYQIKNRANLLVFTNDEVPVFLEAGDRRYCIVDSDVDPREISYYDNLWPWTESHLGEILHYFQNRDLTRFNPKEHAPFTPEKAILLEATDKLYMKEIRRQLEAKSGLFQKSIISLEEFTNYHLKLAIDDTRLQIPLSIRRNMNKTARLMKILGFIKIGQIRVDEHGRKIVVWCTSKCEYWQARQESELATEYNKKCFF